ncbi:MAG TPA: LUD domain-containing protein [Bacillota bacterium]
MSDRERFLARVRRALGRAAGAGPGHQDSALGAVGGSYRAALPPRADHPGDDPSAWRSRFVAELEAVGGSAEAVARAALGTAAAAYAARLKISRVVAWDPALLPEDAGRLLADALAALSAAGLDVRTWPAAAADAEMGVVVAEAAIAASGTVMISSGPGKGRSVSLLPEHLLVLVPAPALRPTLGEALADVAGMTRSGRIPHNVTLITGPSKSADIEQQMIRGVHGPRTVHALVLHDG